MVHTHIIGKIHKFGKRVYDLSEIMTWNIVGASG